MVVEATKLRPNEHYTAVLEQRTSRLAAVATELGYEPERLPIADRAETEIEQRYAESDAVVIMGGDDIDPKLYGGAADYPERGHHVTLADERTVELIRRAGADRKPVFGICRGLQLLNVTYGGTLVQHLDNAGAHRYAPGPQEHEYVSHRVSIDPDSIVGRALGSEEAVIESTHHQAVAELGEGLRAVSHAQDGVVEAIEHEVLPQFAVQWHPEAPGSAPDELPQLLRALVQLGEAGA